MGVSRVDGLVWLLNQDTFLSEHGKPPAVTCDACDCNCCCLACVCGALCCVGDRGTRWVAGRGAELWQAADAKSQIDVGRSHHGLATVREIHLQLDSSQHRSRAHRLTLLKPSSAPSHARPPLPPCGLSTGVRPPAQRAPTSKLSAASCLSPRRPRPLPAVAASAHRACSWRSTPRMFC